MRDAGCCGGAFAVEERERRRRAIHALFESAGDPNVVIDSEHYSISHGPLIPYPTRQQEQEED